MKRYYLEYDDIHMCWDVFDHHSILIDSFEYEDEAASYCDHLNENDY